MKARAKWVGIVFGTLLGLIILASLALYSLGESRLNRAYNISQEFVTIPSDEASLAEGKRIFQYRG